MTINNNLMNPVPLWTSKNDWYCKKATNHGNCVHPVVPNGMMPKMALTVGGGLPSSITRSVTATDVENFPASLQKTYRGSVPENIYNTGMVFPAVGETSTALTVIYNGSGFEVTIGGYSVFLGIIRSATTIPQSVLESGNVELGIYYNNSICKFKISALDLSYYASTSITVTLKKYADDSTVTSGTFTGQIQGAGENYTSARAGSMFLGGTNFTGTFDNGVYYIQFTVDGTTYYSEPFMWLTNLNQYLHVTYRRSTPVVTTDNCIVFEYNGTARSLEAWLPGLLMMPPFTFNDEVDEIDGRKFTRKQVSYKDEKCEFMCTAYFAEAIRLLWHCDIRTAGGMRVEYMVRPEIDWNTDNHLCDVKLEFQGDTVMQTNGTASAYGDSSDSSHQSYDASFDASFN